MLIEVYFMFVSPPVSKDSLSLSDDHQRFSIYMLNWSYNCIRNNLIFLKILVTAFKLME